MKLLVRLLLMMMFAPAVAQELAFFNITQQDGLPSNTVYDVMQDSRGFLWVATENGLARYNGFRFREYENNSVRATSASNLLEDDRGRIWLHNFFGEILYVTPDLSTDLRKLDAWEQRYATGFPNLQFYQDTLYVISNENLFQYAPETHGWDVIRFPDALNFNHMIITAEGQRWVCYSNTEQLIVRPLGEAGFQYKIDRSVYPLAYNLPRLIEWKGNLLLYENRLKRLFSLKDGIVEDITDIFQTDQKSIRMIRNFGDSLLVFLKPDGVEIYQNDQMTQLLPGKNVSSFTVDREGGYWVGTLNEGLFYIPNIHTQLFPKAQFGLYGKLAASEEHGLIFGGSYLGDISIFEASGNYLSSFKNPSNTQKEVQSLYYDAAKGELIVGESNIWGLDIPHMKQTFITSAPALKDMVRINAVKMALATSAGLYYLDKENNKTAHGPLRDLRIAALDYDPKAGMLWMGTQKGVYYHYPDTEEYALWQMDSTGYSPGATSLQMLPDGRVLIGSTTNGLMVVKNGKLVSHFTTDDQLPSNKITAIAVRGDEAWLGTEKGIGIVNLHSGKVSQLNGTHGLASNEVYDLVFCRGALWVSHAAGVQRFADFGAAKSIAPQVHINTALSNGQPVLNPDQGIVLQPDSRQLSLELDVSNALKSRGNCLIRYQIKELDHAVWHTTTLHDPQLNYQLLPFGKYTLSIKAINQDQVPSSNTLNISLVVLTPFWRQTWFIILSALLVLIITVLIIRWRFLELSKKNKLVLLQQNQEQEMRIAQLTSIRAQMNPHFIFNAMALIQGKVLNGQKEAANDQIHDFSMLMRKVLDFSGKEMIPLKDEIEVLQMYLSIEHDRFDGALEYVLHIDDEVKSEWSMIRIPSLLTQPFVENALRHGLMHKTGPKRLEIEFRMERDYLIIHIRDNGIGRQASMELNKARGRNHNSFAMEAYRKRIDLLNAMHKQKIVLDIIDHFTDKQMAAGTSVIIQIALQS